MNTNALFKIGYGLYILSAHENGKDNGCIVNRTGIDFYVNQRYNNKA